MKYKIGDVVMDWKYKIGVIMARVSNSEGTYVVKVDDVGNCRILHEDDLTLVGESDEI